MAPPSDFVLVWLHADDLWRIDLPLELLHRYHHEIVRGDFYVQVTGAILVQDELIVATAFVLAGPPHTAMLSVCRRATWSADAFAWKGPIMAQKQKASS